MKKVNRISGFRVARIHERMGRRRRRRRPSPDHQNLGTPATSSASVFTFSRRAPSGGPVWACVRGRVRIRVRRDRDEDPSRGEPGHGGPHFTCRLL
ncbi:unnamed protein product [Nesidiocoris tenuis]|uniref:Uncharacterized protein n=1 Tax=Nesidiocoris tenuis TaxID=355587 RepID=A0A6H5HMZ7_9HEMI|nr:unnamed protein product [Nesidiocoris tenuis]